jgi:hypothetical protein
MHMLLLPLEEKEHQLLGEEGQGEGEEEGGKLHTLDSKYKLFVTSFVICTHVWDMKVF